MDVSEPRVRRRGFFLHSDTTGEPDSAERESPEGLTIRVGVTRRPIPHQMPGAASARLSNVLLGNGRSRTPDDLVDEGLPQIRSGSVTGSRQRAGTPR
jgi:hypothetical protein